MSDIHLHGFTPTTEDFLAEWFDRLSGYGHRKWVPFEAATQLVFVLRKLSDDDFPNGKWATIQHLESLIEEATPQIIQGLVQMETEDA